MIKALCKRDRSWRRFKRAMVAKKHIFVRGQCVGKETVQNSSTMPHSKLTYFRCGQNLCFLLMRERNMIVWSVVERSRHRPENSREMKVHDDCLTASRPGASSREYDIR
ncbi:uncharacterized protein PV09_07569 [Verruconis gallopava]|uniref:Uncharacterized protein n=1 Tax=Verruconis gallopava TaxID=253628 RepID=A0A0D2A3Q9_9PEZI|nr:uncharacterized protein PV09_07569 [Verruconis gallopava]KIW01055.1 hypothetical protein PV09_07569 [Verruconis gallopava]